MKRIAAILGILIMTSCAELQTIVDQLPTVASDTEISAGLRQALQFGIDKEVTKLTKEDGFFNNNKVRIGLPPELQKVDKTLRDLGLDALADEGLRVLNRAAEDAVGEAIPVFTKAVSEITFTDAKDILMGPDNAATIYLTRKTEDELYAKFFPLISNSLEKVGATKIWRNIIEKYNTLPLTTNVNPDLPDYVTEEALDGVYLMIAEEEQEIRNNVTARTTDLLKRVFSIQD